MTGRSRIPCRKPVTAGDFPPSARLEMTTRPRSTQYSVLSTQYSALSTKYSVLAFSMIKAIGFDLWETLITDTPDVSKRQERLRLARMEEILALAGYTAAAAEIEHAYRVLWHRCLDLYWSADVDIPCRRQIEHFLEALRLDPDAFEESALQAMESAYANAAVEI